MNAGDVYQFSYGGHVWVVVSDPATDPLEVVVVNFTSNKSWQDQSCVLQVGDHPYITKPTVMFYARADIIANRELDAHLAAGRIKLEASASAALLARIRQGAADSPHLPFRHHEILKNQGLI